MKVTKRIIAEEFALSAAEKRILRDWIHDIRWECVFKPENCGVSPFLTEDECYDEILWIRIFLKCELESKIIERVNEMFQKLIPYPTLIWMESESEYAMGGAIKRVHQQDKTLRVIEELICTHSFGAEDAQSIELTSKLSFNMCFLQCHDLKTAYSRMLIPILEFNALKKFGLHTEINTQKIWRSKDLLNKLDKLTQEISTLKNQINQATQMSERVALNTRIASAEKLRQEIMKELK